MGFYGNITNTSNTTFSFDRIYPNRLAMDANANNDGIFIGRYVLVEYDQNAAYPNIYINNGKYYSSPNFEEITRIKYKSGGRPASDTSNDVFYLGEFGQKQESEKIYFYMCDGYETVEENLYATFKQVTAVNKDDATPYLINHNIDYEEYKNAKGYDSSVWTKVNEEKNGKLVTRYRNIADLNSVVPTFDLETDAPTMTPITPHFDADSTNVYYKLHTQPQWGLRVAAKSNEINSDGVTTWMNTTYDPITDTTTTYKDENVIAAINYNGPAFEKQIDKNRTNEIGIKKHDNSNNYITILPTGESGQKYYTHTNKNGEKVYEKAPDIQEMRISLPVIGNMISDAWDIIHGPYRNDDMREFDTNGKNVSSLKGRLDSIDALEDDTIPVKRDIDGKLVGNKINGGKTTDTDYTGKDDDEWIETLVNGNEEKITIHHTYDLEDKTNYKDIGHLEGKLNNNNDTTNFIDLNNNINTIDINTPIVDSMGHIVGRNTETITLPYGYKYIETNNSNLVNTASVSADGTTQMADNTQDTIKFNASNKWIKLDSSEEDIIKFGHIVEDIEIENNNDTDLNDEETKSDKINIPDWSYDEAGHIRSKQNHTYILPFGYKSFTDEKNNASIAKDTQDEFIFAGDSWLEPTVEQGKITYSHIGPVEGEQRQETNEEPNFGDTFVIEDWTFDEKGHKNTFSSHTIKIPQGDCENINNIDDNNNVIQTSQLLSSIGLDKPSGKITARYNTTNSIQLSGYDNNKNNNHSNNINAVQDNDTLNTALAKLQNQIDNEIKLRKAAIDTLYYGKESSEGKSIAEAFDTIKEIADWLDNDATTGNGTGVETLFDSIENNSQAISAEVLRAQEEESKINYSIESETLRAEQAETNLQEQINSLGTASTKAIEDFATAKQGSLAETAIQLDTKFIYTEEVKDTETDEILIPEVKITIEQLIQKVAELENEIKILKGE